MNTASQNTDAEANMPSTVEAQLRAALSAVLAPLAAQQATAREAYAAMTRVVARIEGDVPTGARLVGLLQLFNAQRPESLPPIPAGTAGVAQDCVASYRRSLVRAATQGVGHKALPPDMIESLNQWLERLVDLLNGEIRRPYEVEALKLQARMDEEIAALRLSAEADQLAAREAMAQQAAALLAKEQELDALRQSLEAQVARIEEQSNALQRSEEEMRGLTARAAVLQAQVAEQDKQITQLREEVRQSRTAEDDERRQRLLSIDASRVLEQELAREKERRKATEAMARTLEKYLEEEKAKAGELQAILSSMQRASETAASASAGMQPSARIKPVRPRNPLAGTMRKKTLR